MRWRGCRPLQEGLCAAVATERGGCCLQRCTPGSRAKGQSAAWAACAVLVTDKAEVSPLWASFSTQVRGKVRPTCRCSPVVPTTSPLCVFFLSQRTRTLARLVIFGPAR